MREHNYTRVETRPSTLLSGPRPSSRRRSGCSRGKSIRGRPASTATSRAAACAACSATTGTR
jgi:hypothetical protein